MNLNISYVDWQIPFFFDWKPGVKYKTCRKGRRAALTHGASHAIIEWLLDGTAPILWGETTHGNIERYYERYFKPTLDKNNIKHHFDRQAKKLSIGKNYCDFRSADNPENWEGFGYKKIFLNEAGIILKNKSLYINSVLPMLLDYPDSHLIAGGVPKGRLLKDGSEHPFWTLCKRAESGLPQYETLHLTSYDNPLLGEQDIKDLEAEIEAFSPEQVRQEIYGEFIEMDALNPFAFQFAPHHENPRAIFRPEKQVYISVDFNLNPFAVTFFHLWQDERGLFFHAFDCEEIQKGSIPAMINFIKSRYESSLPNCYLTGDSTGDAGDMSQIDNASKFEQLRRGLGLRPAQVVIVNNPKHTDSRTDCNYLLYNSREDGSGFFHVGINPDTCSGLVRDLKTVQCDAFGSIIKRDRKDISQRADLMDTFRSAVHTFVKKYITAHQKSVKHY